MGPPVVVVFHPHRHALLRLLEALKLRTREEFRVDRLPEPLDLAQRLWMMRAAAKVMDRILLQLPLKARLATPVGILPAVIGQHLLGHAVIGHRTPIHLQHMLRRLAPIQSQPDDVPGMIVHEPDQVRILPQQPNRADVALPHLIGRGPLEEARLGRIAHRLALRFLDELLLMQYPSHRLTADRQQEPPPQHLRDLLHPQCRLLLLQRGDLLPHRRRQPRPLRCKHTCGML